MFKLSPPNNYFTPSFLSSKLLYYFFHISTRNLKLYLILPWESCWNKIRTLSACVQQPVFISILCLPSLYQGGCHSCGSPTLPLMLRIPFSLSFMTLYLYPFTGIITDIPLYASTCSAAPRKAKLGVGGIMISWFSSYFTACSFSIPFTFLLFILTSQFRVLSGLVLVYLFY